MDTSLMDLVHLLLGSVALVDVPRSIGKLMQLPLVKLDFSLPRLPALGGQLTGEGIMVGPPDLIPVAGLGIVSERARVVGEPTGIPLLLVVSMNSEDELVQDPSLLDGLPSLIVLGTAVAVQTVVSLLPLSPCVVSLGRKTVVGLTHVPVGILVVPAATEVDAGELVELSDDRNIGGVVVVGTGGVRHYGCIV